MKDAMKRHQPDVRASAAMIRDLERRILSAELPDRSRLPSERQLMKEFGVSRGVVREAIAALAHRGLLALKPRYRPVVCRPDVNAALHAAGGVVQLLLRQGSGLRNLYESRIFVEKALVREAASNGTIEDIESLRSALMDNRDAVNNSTEFYATDMAFHRVLYRIARNPVFPALHDAYTAWLSPHWLRMPRSKERNLINYRSHVAIFEAIVDHRPDDAATALGSHLDAAWEFVKVTFRIDDER